MAGMVVCFGLSLALSSATAPSSPVWPRWRAWRPRQVCVPPPPRQGQSLTWRAKGGQYHWVSEFAPAKYQRFLSYAAGWMSTLGWLASTASSVFIGTTLIQVLIDVYQANFGFSNWQYTLIMLAVLLVTIIFNTYMAPVLPMIETISLIGHIVGFIVTLVSLWVMCPKNSASDVFTTVVNSGGWSNSTSRTLRFNPFSQD